MRSTAFLFLGLTAAAGLALVAIFAQLNFPLLSPVPLRGGPSEGGGVSRAVALGRGGALALAPARPSVSAPGGRGNGSAGGTAVAPVEHGGDRVGMVGSPTPLPAPTEAGIGDDGGPTPATPATPPSVPAPSGTPDPVAPQPTPDPTPEPSPESASKDDRKPAKSKPARPAKQKPKADQKKQDKDKSSKSDSKAAKDDSKSAKSGVKPAKGDATTEKEDQKAEEQPEETESKTPGPRYDPAPVPEPPDSQEDDSKAKEHDKGKALGHEK